MSITVCWNAWPMCSVPVTFGGGSRMQYGSPLALSPSPAGLNTPLASQRAYQVDSIWAGSKLFSMGTRLRRAHRSARVVEGVKRPLYGPRPGLPKRTGAGVSDRSAVASVARARVCRARGMRESPDAGSPRVPGLDVRAMDERGRGQVRAAGPERARPPRAVVESCSDAGAGLGRRPCFGRGARTRRLDAAVQR